MRRDEVVQMKKPYEFTNPAKNEVLESSEDTALSAYLKEISDYRALSTAEERRLAKLIKDGDTEAKKKLIQANLKLVVTVAKKVIHTSPLPLIDLIQEGNLGLMVAAEKFNYRLGYKFATYASWWIKQSMFKAISEQGHAMKIPVYIQETLSKFSKVKAQMERENNCQVKTAEVAKKMNIPAEKIDTFLSAYSKTISIENSAENSEGREMNVADILEDQKASVFKAVELENLKHDLTSVIENLKERERDVIKMRFGLDDTVKYTLEEIGNIYGVTKECIRQTELRALKKMRGQELLAGYID